MSVVRSGILELLSWVEREPRAYPEAIEVWRTTGPQHAVWEDALDERLIEVVRSGHGAQVVVTARGRALLDAA